MLSKARPTVVTGKGNRAGHGEVKRQSGMTGDYTIKPLDESTWDAFAALVEANGGIFGGCWCMGFHPEEHSHADSPQPHREQKLDRVRAGTAHAALVIDGNDCVGWCQFGPQDEVPRVKNRREYEKQLTALPDWRIACCYVGKGHRRKGVAYAALLGALELIAELGGGRVEGYPEPAEAVPAGFLYQGALSSFEKAGFSLDRKIGKHRWVVVKDVPTNAEGTPAHQADQPWPSCWTGPADCNGCRPGSTPPEPQHWPPPTLHPKHRMCCGSSGSGTPPKLSPPKPGHRPARFTPPPAPGNGWTTSRSSLPEPPTGC
jgi:GNAT superfamily N-acetyltransferase